MKNQINKLVALLMSYRNDGTDPRKNDLWRVLAFSCISGASIAFCALTGKWAYYTQNVLELGITLTLVTTPLRLVDAVTDPIIASLFDSYQPKGKMGKYRLFMLIGSLITFVPIVVIFFYPIQTMNAIDFSFLGAWTENINVSFWLSCVILTICSAVHSIGTTVLNTATRAGQAIITQDPKQRPIFSLGKTAVDAVIAAFVAVVITGGAIGDMQDQWVWQVAAIILAVVAMLFIFGAMKAIETRDNPTYYALTSNAGKTDIKEFMRLIKRSKPMRSMIVAVASDSIAASVRASITIYLFANIILNYKLSASFEILNGVIFGIPILLTGMYLATKKGSTLIYSKISLIQTILSAAGFVIAVIFLRGDENSVYEGLTVSVMLIMFVFGLYISSLAISTNLVNAMTGDLTDYEYTQSGKFIPGTIGATMTFVTKCVNSVVGLITAAMMIFCFGSSDYVIDSDIYQNDRFFYCVLIGIFILPSIGHFITYLAMKGYPLTEEKMEEVSHIVADTRKKMQEEKEALIEEVIRKSQEEKSKT